MVTEYDPFPLVDAVLKYTSQRRLQALVESDGKVTKKIQVTLPPKGIHTAVPNRDRVQIVATGELGVIDFDNAVSFGQVLDYSDAEEMESTGDEYVGLALAYLIGEGEMVQRKGLFGSRHLVYVVHFQGLQYEIAGVGHFSRITEL